MPAFQYASVQFIVTQGNLETSNVVCCPFNHVHKMAIKITDTQKCRRGGAGAAPLAVSREGQPPILSYCLASKTP